MKVFKIAVFFSFSIIMNLASLAQPSWELKNNGLPAGSWDGLCIDASDSNNAIISIYSATPKDAIGLYCTSNGGDNWNKLPFSFNEFGTVTHLSIKNNSLVWAATNSGKLYYSSDFGANWVKQFEDTSLTKFINYIRMFDNNSGIAMGDPLPGNPAVFLKTSNGGAEWTVIPNTELSGMNSGDVWRRLDFCDNKTGYFFESGVNPQKLYKTTDGGYSWIDTEFSGYLEVVKCINENFVLGSSANNPQGVFRFTGGGSTKNLFNIPVSWGEDFECIPGDISKIFFADNLKLFYSADSGNTYTEILMNNESFGGRDIVFTDESHGWLLGYGKVYKTKTGGIIASAEEYNSLIPEKNSLLQNYPNPFNPNTTIRFNLDKSQFVVLKVFDVNGKEIKNLFDGTLSAGYHEVLFSGENLASGIYFYQLITENKCLTKKLTLLK